MTLCASCTQIGMSAPSLCISPTRDPSRPAPQSWKPPSHPWKGGCPSGDFLVALTTRDKAGWPFLSVCPPLRSLWVTFSSWSQILNCIQHQQPMNSWRNAGRRESRGKAVSGGKSMMSLSQRWWIHLPHYRKHEASELKERKMSCQARMDAALQFPRGLGWNTLKFSWNLYSLEIPMKNERRVLCFKVSSGPGKWNMKMKTQIFQKKKALLVCWRQKQVRMQRDDDREPGPHLGTRSTQAPSIPTSKVTVSPATSIRRALRVLQWGGARLPQEAWWPWDSSSSPPHCVAWFFGLQALATLQPSPPCLQKNWAERANWDQKSFFGTSSGTKPKRPLKLKAM